MQPTPQSLQLAEQNALFESSQDDAATLIESLEIAANCHGSCEDVLNWPIFEGKYRREHIESLIFNPGLAERSPCVGVEDDALPTSPLDPNLTRELARAQGPGRGVREDDALKLIQKILGERTPEKPDSRCTRFEANGKGCRRARLRVGCSILSRSWFAP